MIQLFRHATDFYFKSTSNLAFNIVAEKLNVVTNEYENPTVLATIEPNEGFVHAFPVDGKYRISYILPEANRPGFPNDLQEVIKVDYIYIESYSVYLKQMVSNVKEFLCAGGTCCTEDGSSLEQALYTINTLLGYYNLATNSKFNSYQLCSGSVLDVFVRKMFDTQRLEFLTEFTRASKMDCLTNDKLTLPLAKKIASVYFLALYFYEIYNQVEVENLNQNITKVNDSYDIVAIRRCITKQGFDFETARETFNEVIPLESIVTGIDKTYHMYTNFVTETYKADIIPEDIYDLSRQDTLRNTIYFNVITLPVLGKLFYTDKRGVRTQITSTGSYEFNLLSTEKITYEYNMLSDSNTDIVLYNITSVQNACEEGVDFNTLSFVSYPYDYDVNAIPLNITSIKVPSKSVVDFGSYHIFKVLKRKLDIYRVKSFSINVPTEVTVIASENQTPVNNADLGIYNLVNPYTIRNGNLTFQNPYEGSISITDINDNIVTIPMFFRLADESEFNQESPMFTINSLNPDITTITFPFYETNYPMFADTIESTEQPQEYYFVDEDTSNDPLEDVTLNSVTVPMPFPAEKVIHVTTGNDRESISKAYTIKNNVADIVVSYNFTGDNNHIFYGEPALGRGVIRYAAWDKGVINSENSYNYGVGEKKTYLEVYPHDRVRINYPSVTDIDIIGTFRRFDLNNTAIGNKALSLVTELEQRTLANNISLLPSYENSFPVYFLANKVGATSFLSVETYQKLYEKGILVNLGRNTTTNPMPLSNADVNKDYSNFSVQLEQVEELGLLSPKIKARIIHNGVEPGEGYADVLIYAQLEGLTELGWVNFKNRFFYNTLKSGVGREAEAIVPVAGLLNVDGKYKFRLTYQGYNGRRVSNELSVVPTAGISDYFIQSVTKVTGGVRVQLTDRLPVGKTLRVVITADNQADIFVQQRDITRQEDAALFTLIGIPYLTEELLDKATLYATAIYENTYEDVKAIEGIENRVAIIPEVEGGNTLAKEYSFEREYYVGKDMLLYHQLPDIAIPEGANTDDTEVSKTIHVLLSTDNIVYSEVSEGESVFARVPLNSVAGVNRFYVKSIVNYYYLDATDKHPVVFKSVETYSITINLT